MSTIWVLLTQEGSSVPSSSSDEQRAAYLVWLLTSFSIHRYVYILLYFPVHKEEPLQRPNPNPGASVKTLPPNLGSP